MDKLLSDRRKTYVMFDAIAKTYDRANRLISGGSDIIMRARLTSELPRSSPFSLIDLASGTGDQLLSAFRRRNNLTKAVALDLSTEMLAIGRKKFDRKNFGVKIETIVASAEKIPFADESFTCASISFGIRNVPSPLKCLQEMKRVISPGGKALILETSLPKNFIVRTLYLLYFRKILPTIGGLISKNKEAYSYLNKSSELFPSPDEFLSLMRKSGLKNARAISQFGGAATLYIGEK